MSRKAAGPGLPPAHAHPHGGGAALDVTIRRPLFRDPRRLLLAGVGVVCVGLAAVGAVMPGLPTTIFLIVASYCFARSCPWLEERLLRAPLFSRYMDVVAGRRPFTRTGRATALAAMWTSVLASLAVLATAGRLHRVLVLTLLAAAAAGTVAILRYRRG